jgi:hypothetical protein
MTLGHTLIHQFRGFRLTSILEGRPIPQLAFDSSEAMSLEGGVMSGDIPTNPYKPRYPSKVDSEPRFAYKDSLKVRSDLRKSSYNFEDNQDLRSHWDLISFLYLLFP